MKQFSILLAAVALAVACTSSADKSLNEKDIAEIRNVMNDYREAWIRGDSAAVLKRICDDMILYMPTTSGKPKIGKDAIASFWFPPSNVSYPITAYQVTRERIEGSGNMCIYSGVSLLTWHTKTGEVRRDTTTSVSEFLNILKKVDGQWKLYRIIYNLKDSAYNQP